MQLRYIFENNPKTLVTKKTPETEKIPMTEAVRAADPPKEKIKP